MKIFKDSFDGMPPEILEMYKHVIPEYNETKALAPELDFMEYFGGYIHLLESLDEIKEIDTGTMHPVEDRFFNLSEVSDTFDICEWSSPSYVEVCNITSNSGGAVYFVPRDLALQHVFLLESVLKSTEQYED